MKVVLIISHSEDYHVSQLLPRLAENDSHFFTLYLDRFPRDYHFTSQCENGKYHTQLTDINRDLSLDLSQVGAVWLRKPAPFQYHNNQLEQQLRTFCDGETEHALFSALYGLPCYWLSHPKDLRGAMWKGEQLQRAQRFGFKVPDTLISQNPDEIKRFYQRHGQIIYKAMANDVMTDSEGVEHGIATTLVDETMLADSDALALSPNLFQAYVEKAFELRVTLIGERLFAAKLDSQLHPDTRIDCRNLNVAMPITAFQLPKHIEQACFEFIKSYQLNYSALDLIVTPSGEYVFLENNPNGQFMFIAENIPELGIEKHLAQLLHEACQ